MPGADFQSTVHLSREAVSAGSPAMSGRVFRCRRRNSSGVMSWKRRKRYSPQVSIVKQWTVSGGIRKSECASWRHCRTRHPYAFLCTLPFSYDDLMATRWEALKERVLLGILFIVVCATFISYMLIVVGQKNLCPTVAGMYNYIQPLVACIVTVSLGLDTFNLTKGLAVCLLFGGVYLVSVSKSRAKLERDAQAMVREEAGDRE